MGANSKYNGNDKLVARFRNGDRDALKYLIRNFHPRMVCIIQFHTRAREPAEGIAQVCWYHIIPKLGCLELKIGFEARIKRKPECKKFRPALNSFHPHKKLTEDVSSGNFKPERDQQNSGDAIRNRQIPAVSRPGISKEYSFNLNGDNYEKRRNRQTRRKIVKQGRSCLLSRPGSAGSF